MRFNTLFFLLILSCLCFTLAQVSFEDCCLKYVKTLSRNHQKHAVSYRRQKTDGGCNIPAVILTMRKGRRFCADPNEKWVKALIEKIPEKNDKISSKKASKKRLKSIVPNSYTTFIFALLQFYYRAKSSFYGDFYGG